MSKKKWEGARAGNRTSATTRLAFAFITHLALSLKMFCRRRHPAKDVSILFLYSRAPPVIVTFLHKFIDLLCYDNSSAKLEYLRSRSVLEKFDWTFMDGRNDFSFSWTYFSYFSDLLLTRKSSNRYCLRSPIQHYILIKYLSFASYFCQTSVYEYFYSERYMILSTPMQCITSYLNFNLILPSRDFLHDHLQTRPWLSTHWKFPVDLLLDYSSDRFSSTYQPNNSSSWKKHLLWINSREWKI